MPNEFVIKDNDELEKKFAFRSDWFWFFVILVEYWKNFSDKISTAANFCKREL